MPVRARRPSRRAGSGGLYYVITGRRGPTHALGMAAAEFFPIRVVFLRIAEMLGGPVPRTQLDQYRS